MKYTIKDWNNYSLNKHASEEMENNIEEIGNDSSVNTFNKVSEFAGYFR